MWEKYLLWNEMGECTFKWKLMTKLMIMIVVIMVLMTLRLCWNFTGHWQGRTRLIVNIMFIGSCFIVIVEEWKTNLMSLAILFHFLCAEHVSDINTSIIRSLRLCCWITTSVVSFCRDGWFSCSVNLRCIVVCVWCDVLCRFVVVGRCILIDIDRYMLCFVITVFVCVWYVSLVIWYLVHC